MIRLVGPGGAGKSTAGASLARRLGVNFVDLDEELAAKVGDVSQYLDVHGYDAYARQNIEVYLEQVAATPQDAVLALSSGFMTYPPNIHPAYEPWRRKIASSASTFVLLPSLVLETCVAGIVRRQLTRPFARSAHREERVIRDRFPSYVSLPAPKVETMRPVREVVDTIVAALAAQRAAAADERRDREPSGR